MEGLLNLGAFGEDCVFWGGFGRMDGISSWWVVVLFVSFEGGRSNESDLVLRVRADT